MSGQWSGRRVLVTGATAFTGSFLAEWLLQEKAHVRMCFRNHFGAAEHLKDRAECMQGDLRDSGFCTQLLDGVTDIFHLASMRRNVAYHREHREEVMEGNKAMTEALLSVLRQHSSLPVTYFSTAMAGSLESQGVSVDEIPDGYIAGKILCEQLWQQAAQEQSFPLLVVRPVNIYGPRDTFSQDGNVIPSLITKAAQNRDQLTVWGSGAQERSFLYVEDVPRALSLLLEEGTSGIAYLCPPESVTIRSLAEQIRDLVQPGLPLHFDTSRPEGVSSVAHFPLSPCLRNFHWMPFAEGLRRTVEWFRNESCANTAATS